MRQRTASDKKKALQYALHRGANVKAPRTPRPKREPQQKPKAIPESTPKPVEPKVVPTKAPKTPKKQNSIKDPIKVTMKVPNAVSIPIRATQAAVRTVTAPVRATKAVVTNTKQRIQNKVDATKQSFQNVIDQVTLKGARDKVKNTTSSLKEGFLDRLSPKRMFNRLREQIKADTTAIINSELENPQGVIKTSFAQQAKLITDIGKDVKLVRKDTTDIKKTLEKSFKELNKKLDDIGGSGSASSFFNPLNLLTLDWKKILLGSVLGGGGVASVAGGMGSALKKLMKRSGAVDDAAEVTKWGRKVAEARKPGSGIFDAIMDTGKKLKEVDIPKPKFKMPELATKAVESIRGFSFSDTMKKGWGSFKKSGVLDNIEMPKIKSGGKPLYLSSKNIPAESTRGKGLYYKFLKDVDAFATRFKIPGSVIGILVEVVTSALDPYLAYNEGASEQEVRKQIVGAIASMSGAGIGAILGTIATVWAGPFAAVGTVSGAIIGSMVAEQAAELIYSVITGEVSPEGLLNYFKLKKWEPSLKTGETIILPEREKYKAPEANPNPTTSFGRFRKSNPPPAAGGTPMSSVGGSDMSLGGEADDMLGATATATPSGPTVTSNTPSTKALEPFKNRVGGIDSSYGTYLSDQRDQMPSMYGSRFKGRTAESSIPGYGPGTSSDTTGSAAPLSEADQATIAKLTSGQEVGLSDQSFLNKLSSEELKALGIERSFDEDESGKKHVTFKAVAPEITDEQARKSLATSSEKVGSISAKYEGKVDTVGGDGGRAYGKYQFDYKVGGLQTFFKDNPEFAKEFDGLQPGTKAFNDKWKQVAAANPTAFEEAQDKSAKNIWFNPAKDHAAGIGFKTDNPGIREAIFSGAIQHGGIKKILDRASQHAGFADMTPQDQLKAFYEERTKYIDTDTKLTGDRRASVLSRYKTELADTLKFADKPAVAEGTTKFSEDQIREEKTRLANDVVEKRKTLLEGAARKHIDPSKDPVGAIRSAASGDGQGAIVDRALKQLGMNEDRDRDAIKSYLKDGGVDLDPDVLAWCAAFVNSTLKQEGFKGTGSAVATSFGEWGKSVAAGDMKKGDILVEMRGKAAGEVGGHVGMATGETRMKGGRLQIEMLGGNQGDTVTKKWVDADKLNIRRAEESDMTPELIAKREEQLKKAENVTSTDVSSPKVKPTGQIAPTKRMIDPKKESSLDKKKMVEKTTAAKIENKSTGVSDPSGDAEEDRATRESTKPERKPTDVNTTSNPNYQGSHPQIDPSFKKTIQKQTNNPMDRKQSYIGTPIPV